MNILIPTDFSTAAEHAALFALKLNQLKATKFIFLHGGSSEGAKEKLDHFSAKIQKHSVHGNIEFINIVRDEAPDDKLLNEIIKEFSIELVIRGTEGRDGFVESLFKSNTFHVINNIQCPVITIPETFELRPIKKIGYASDLTMLAKEMNHIIPIAKALNVSIDIVHVYPVFPQVIDIAKYNTTEALHTLHDEFNYQKFEFVFIETEKDNHTLAGLNQYIAENNPDMLALFTRERSLFDKILDPSLTANLATHAEIPVLSFPVIELS
jgi:nucleotide-binding universal stress UspA family protein